MTLREQLDRLDEDIRNKRRDYMSGEGTFIAFQDVIRQRRNLINESVENGELVTKEELEAAIRDRLNNLPWREKDIKRGLILFRTSNNAHGFTNYSSLSSKVDALPDAAKEELAAIMTNMALGFSKDDVLANGVVKQAISEAVQAELQARIAELEARQPVTTQGADTKRAYEAGYYLATNWSEDVISCDEGYANWLRALAAPDEQSEYPSFSSGDK